MWIVVIFFLAVLAVPIFGIVGFATVLVGGVVILRLHSAELRLGQVESELKALTAMQRAEMAEAIKEDLAAPPPPPVVSRDKPAAAAPAVWHGPQPVSLAKAPIPRAATRWERQEPPAWQAAMERKLAEFALPDRGGLEQLVAGRGLAIAGGAALIMGAVFFLGLAFSRGWIGPEMRVVIGLVAGAAIFGLGAWLLRREHAIVAHVLVAVGLAVLSLSLFAATRLYDLVIPEVGVAAALAVAVVTAVLAIVSGSQLIAAFGLVAVLGSPPIMGSSASLLTMLFLGAALVGTTAISVYRGWLWLSPLAFLVASPQLAAYLFDTTDVGIGLAAIGVFWVLNASAAAGAEWSRRHDGGGQVPITMLTSTTATLVVVNAAFATWGGLQVLTGDLDAWRGLFLLILAIASSLVAVPFLVRRGLIDPFGMVAAGSGIAVLTLAVPIQLGDTWIPMAWTAEAVALTLLAVRRRHLPAAASAVVLGALAVGQLLAVHYPIELLASAPPDAIPFWNASGAALGVVLLGVALSAWMAPGAAFRVPLVALGGLLVIVAASHELTRIPFAILLGLIGVASVLIERRLLQLRAVHPDVANLELPAIGRRALYLPATVAALNLISIPLFVLAPPDRFVDGLAGTLPLPEVPFLTETTLIIAIGAASALVIALAIDGQLWRQGGIFVAALGITYLIPTQVSPAWTAVGWVVLALILHALGTRFGLAWLRIGAPTPFGAALLLTLLEVTPPIRLVVRATPFDETMILNGGILAVGAIVVALAVRGWAPPRDHLARWARLAAAVALLYLLSVATVDVFQVRLGGSIRLEELQKQAQVALSVLWAVIGLSSLVFGLARNLAEVRIGGLGLLAVVTLKVFVIDLAALDVAYRVLSFVALGVLLLVAAYLYRRMQHPGPMQPHTRG